jgi:hypothetical protein
MDVGCFQFPGFLRSENPTPKNGTEAIALGRHGGRLFPLPGVFAE